MEQMWQQVTLYGLLSESAREALSPHIKERKIVKGEYYIKEGSTPQNIAFVQNGLLIYYYTTDNGDIVIKKFFSENTFVAAVSALIQNKPSQISIQALEDSVLYELSFRAFKKLTTEHQELAQIYISYLETNWVIEKEQEEISLRYDTADIRYQSFSKRYAELIPRLKLHYIASYLGITHTQLSRIRKEL